MQVIPINRSIKVIKSEFFSLSNRNGVMLFIRNYSLLVAVSTIIVCGKSIELLEFMSHTLSNFHATLLYFTRYPATGALSQLN